MLFRVRFTWPISLCAGSAHAKRSCFERFLELWAFFGAQTFFGAKTFGARTFGAKTNLPLVALALFICGCAETGKLEYLGDSGDVEYYKEHATQIDFPHVHSATSDAAFSLPPRTIADLRKDEINNVSLEECRSLALMNSRVIRAGNLILSNPNNAPSIYDPAIQESGVLFGGRGIEAALSAFDATFQTTAGWGRDETATTSAVANGNRVRETGGGEATLSKVFAYGGQFELSHDVSYLGTNSPMSGFAPSSYSGSTSAQYRHPLMAGSGTEYTQIAGPISTNFGGLSGVTQGVVIARINHDISLTRFESAVTNLLKEVEDGYWNLYLQYRVYDTSVVAMKSAQQTWHVTKRKLDGGGLEGFQVEDEAQARDRFFDTRATSELNLSQLYKSESALRRLIGLSVNDGKIMRPADEPISAKFEADWAVSIADALTNRIELRQHKWGIKSLELQLKAAENLVRPRLDFVAGYSVNGFGDDLIDHDKGEPLNSFYSLLAQNNHTGWEAGFTFALPIGLRSAKAQVRNIELRLAKARDVLAAQELEVSHEIGSAFQELAENYTIAKSYFNRRVAARRQVEIIQKKYDQGTQSVDLLVRAQASLADAEIAYFRSLVAYNQALINLQYRQGTLLAYNSVSLGEGNWDPDAYVDALRRARARTNAFDTAKYQTTKPTEFVEHDPTWEGPNVWPLETSNENNHTGPDLIEPVPTPQATEPELKLDQPILEAPEALGIQQAPPLPNNSDFEASQNRPNASSPIAQSWHATGKKTFFPHMQARAKTAAKSRRPNPRRPAEPRLLPTATGIRQVEAETSTTVTEVINAN